MVVDGSIKIDTKIDQSGIEGSLKSMRASIAGVVRGIESQLNKINFSGLAKVADAAFKSIKKSAQSVFADIEKATRNTSNGLGGMLTTAFAGISIGAFGKAALESTAQIELATVKLETLLGSAEQAQSMIQDIIKMADVTPYGGEDLIQAATTLKTFGVTAEEIMPTLTALGNAAGGSAENLAGVARALGQTKAQGKMMTQDLYQFVNAGVPLLDLLAKRLKKTKGEIKGMIEEGRIGYKEVNGALKEFYTGNGKYANLMAKAAQTLPGMFSTMKDSMMSFGREVVTALEPTLKNMMSIITTIFTKLTNWMRELSPATRENLVTLAKMVVVFIAVAGAVVVLKSALLTLFTVIRANPIGFLIGILGSLVYAMLKAGDATRDFTGMTAVQAQKTSEYVDEMEKSLDKFIETSTFGWKKTAEGKKYIQEMSAEFLKNTSALSSLKYGTDEYNDTLAKINAQYAILTSGKAKSLGVTDAETAKIKKLKAEVDALQKSRVKSAGKIKTEIESPEAMAATTEEKKRIEEYKKLQEDLWAWEVEERGGALAREQLVLIQARDAELEIAGNNFEMQNQIYHKYEVEREKAIKKHLHYEEMYSFLTGLGISEQLAQGIDEGLHFVASAANHIVRVLDDIFDGVGEVLEGAFDIASYLSDFKASDMSDSFKSFIEGLQNFFDKELGSIPIWFDLAMGLFGGFLDGMIANLPAILESVANVIDHIINYFVANGDRIITQITRLVLSLFQVIVEKLPAIFAIAFQAFMSFLKELTKMAPQLIDSIFTAISEMIVYIGEHASELTKALSNLFTTVLIGLINNMPQILAALAAAMPEIAVALMVTLGVELVKASPYIVAALVKAIFESLIEVPKALAKSLVGVGVDLIQGIIKGMLSAPKIWDKVKQIFTGFVDKIKNFFGIASPSKMFYQFGVDLMRGMINGILSYANLLISAILNLFNRVLGAVTSLLSNFSNIGALFGSALLSGFMSVAGQLKDAIAALFDIVIDEVLTNLRNLIIDTLWSMVDSLAGRIIDGVVDAVRDIIPGAGGGGGLGGIIDTIGGFFADGTDFAPGGLAVVGEEGPELVNLPRGSQVIPNAGTESILRGLKSGNGLNNVLPTAGMMGGQNIILQSQMTVYPVIDGRVVAQAVFKNIDKVAKSAYAF